MTLRGWLAFCSKVLIAVGLTVFVAFLGWKAFIGYLAGMLVFAAVALAAEEWLLHKEQKSYEASRESRFSDDECI